MEERDRMMEDGKNEGRKEGRRSEIWREMEGEDV